jgi:hypothetical protein
MSDFTIHAHGAMLTLRARTERARTRIAALQPPKSSAEAQDRLLVNREPAREIVQHLKFERYSVEGEEVI